MEKCYNSQINVAFKEEKICVDLTNKENPFEEVKNNRERYYYSYSYDEDENYPYFEIYVTEKCNMKCAYCFNQFDQTEKETEPLYSINDLISFIKKKSVDNKAGIKFLGGEPLMKKAWIYDFVRELDKESIEIAYNINTNLTLLDEEFIEFAKKHNIWFLVSVNGGDDIYKGGIYKEQIFMNITKLVKAGLTVTGRMVYWPNSSMTLTQLVKECLDTGLKVVSITLPWGRVGTVSEINKIERDLEEFADFYISSILNKDFKYIGVAPFTLYIRHLIFNKPYWKDNCSAGKDIYSIDANGDVYPCHSFSGIEEFKSGSIYSEIVPAFANYNVDTMTPCESCDIRYMCKAKCFGDNYFTNNNILLANEFRCESERRIFACSAYILKKIMEEEGIYSVFRYVIGKGEQKYDNTK